MKILKLIKKIRSNDVKHNDKTLEQILSDGEVYSTNEKKIGTWIDGKPVYRKIIEFGALPNKATKAVNHDIQDLKRVIKLDGFAGSSINRGGITLPHATSSAPVALYAGDTQVYVLTQNDATAYTEAYIYIYYTKTTD